MNKILSIANCRDCTNSQLGVCLLLSTSIHQGGKGIFKDCPLPDDQDFLEPCPWCGKKDFLISLCVEGGKQIVCGLGVEAQGCGASGGLADTHTEAKRKWNRRNGQLS